MAADLILTADCAYPFDYGRLPQGVAVIMGYVGSPLGTPNVWTQAEVDAARATGRAWVPIWTPAAPSLSAQLGLQAGNEMVAKLATYEGLAGCPVFLDIEHSVYVADRAGAHDAWRAWQHVMHQAGHDQAWPYVPWEAQYGWVANWTGERPAQLPAGVIGWQYAGTVDADRYDLSVVAPSVLQAWINQSEGDAMPLSKEDRKWIVEQLQTVQTNVLERLRGIYHDGWDGHPHPAALVHLAAQVSDLGRLITQDGPGQLDPVALAKAVADQLGPDLGQVVADELHRRLGR